MKLNSWLEAWKLDGGYADNGSRYGGVEAARAWGEPGCPLAPRSYRQGRERDKLNYRWHRLLPIPDLTHRDLDRTFWERFSEDDLKSTVESIRSRLIAQDVIWTEELVPSGIPVTWLLELPVRHSARDALETILLNKREFGPVVEQPIVMDDYLGLQHHRGSALLDLVCVLESAELELDPIGFAESVRRPENSEEWESPLLPAWMRTRLPAPAEDSSPYSDDPREVLEFLVSRLPDRERWLVDRRCIDGWTFRAIAERMGISTKRVEQIWSRAIRRLWSSSAAPDRQVLGDLAAKVRDGIGPAAPKSRVEELLGCNPAITDYSQLVMKLAGQYRPRQGWVRTREFAEEKPEQQAREVVAEHGQRGREAVVSYLREREMNPELIEKWIEDFASVPQHS